MSTTVELHRVKAELAALRGRVEVLAARYTSAANSLDTPPTWGKRAVYLRCRDDLSRLLDADA